MENFNEFAFWKTKNQDVNGYSLSVHVGHFSHIMGIKLRQLNKRMQLLQLVYFFFFFFFYIEL